MKPEKKKRRIFGGGRRKRMQESKSVKGNGENLCSCSLDSCSCCTGETVFSFDKLRLLRIAAAIVLFIIGAIVKAPWALELLLFFAAFVIVGYDAVIEGVTDLIRTKRLSEYLLITVAGIGAFCAKFFAEGAMVMILYRIAESVRNFAVITARGSTAELLDLRPLKVNVIEKATLRELHAEELKPGMILVVKPGERFAVDCVVTEGTTTVSMADLTGDPMNLSVSVGDRVLAGCENVGSIIYAKAEKSMDDSAVSRMMRTVCSADVTDAKTVRLMRKVSRIYTPVLMIAALLVAFLIPLLTKQPLRPWIHRGLVLFAAACPCTLIISLPVTYFIGICGAAFKGVLFKSSSALDAAAATGAVLFDKTGTLTTGKFGIEKISAEAIPDDSLLMLAAYAFAFSTEPEARAVRAAYKRAIDISRIEEHQEYPGAGCVVTMNGMKVTAGGAAFLSENGIEVEQSTFDKTIYVAVGDKLAGSFMLADPVKSDARAAVYGIKKSGVKSVAMLSGSGEADDAASASDFGLTGVYSVSGLQESLECLQSVQSQTAKTGKYTLFVTSGDGGEELCASADIGASMCGFESRFEESAAQIICTDGRPLHVVNILAAAKKTKTIALQNIGIGIILKLVILVLGITGVAPLWFAVFADLCASIAAVINATRTLDSDSSSLLQ